MKKLINIAKEDLQMKEINTNTEAKNKRRNIDFQKLEKISITVMAIVFVMAMLGLLFYGMNIYNERYEELHLSIKVTDGPKNHFLDDGKHYYVITGGGIEHQLEFETGGISKMVELEKLEGMQIFKILVEEQGKKEETGISFYVNVQDWKIKDVMLACETLATASFDEESINLNIITYES